MLTLEGFTEDFTDAPVVTLPNIFEYLIKRAAEGDGNARECWKNWNDRRLQKDDHVRLVEYKQITEGKGA